VHGKLEFLQSQEVPDRGGVPRTCTSIRIRSDALELSRLRSRPEARVAAVAKLILALVVVLKRYGVPIATIGPGHPVEPREPPLGLDGVLLSDLERRLVRLLEVGWARDLLSSGRPGLSAPQLDLVDESGAQRFSFRVRSDAAIDGAQRYKELPCLVLDVDDGTVEIEYPTAFSSAAYMHWLGRCLATVCDQVARGGARKISDIDLLDRHLSAGLVQDYCVSEPLSEPRGLCHDYIDRHAQQRPHQLAVVHDGRHSSYRQLQEDSDRIAEFLRSLSEQTAGQPLHVLVWLKPIWFVPATILGIFKAGCVYVPLDIETPPDRIRYVMDDCRPGAVIVEQDSLSRMDSALFSTAVILDVERLLGDNRRSDARQHTVTGDDTAYVIYTSGSTGRPKGVPISHASLRNHMAAWEQTVPAIPERFSGILASSLGFDVSLWELFYVLWRGGTLHILDQPTLRNPKALAQYIFRHHLTTACIRPALLERLAQEFEFAALPCPLVQLFSGAESVTHSVCARFKRLNSNLTIMIGYGTTETTIGATIGFFQDDDDQAIVPVGRPLPGYRIYVVDENLALIPPGLTGEILIGGPFLSKGYLNHPELTARAFVMTSPDKDAERVYRTGDLGRLLPDGRLVFQGRKDDQVKIRGVRIEMQEVSAVLQAVSGATNAAVTVRGEGIGKHLVAYLERPNRPLSEVREKLNAILPSAMIPPAIVALDKLPLNTNTKVDRKQLPEPVYMDYVQSNYVAPSGLIEEQLSKLACQLLKLDKLGANDELAAFGMNSLLALAFLDMINRDLSTELALDDLAGRSTIRSVAERLGQPS
jgi:amino acid adenylation domain-containing protein